MTPFPPTPELLRLAARVVWFKPPEDALSNPIELMAYAMKHSTDEDMAVLLAIIGPEGLEEALDKAPPGIIDPRSWSYWNVRAGRFPTPPMPVRTFGEPTESDRS